MALRFSLVLATVGRTKELERLLASLDAQIHKDFELIVVDQNPDDRLLPGLAPYYGRFPILHLRSTPGLSRSRNIGMQRITGDLVAFPDDDCWYPPGVLECVTNLFCQYKDLGGLTGRSMDIQGGVSGDARFDRTAGLVSVTNVWRRVCAYSMFMRRDVIETIGGFDETLGLGARTLWQGGEDIDYPLRAIKAGFKIYYTPDIQVFHPSPPAAPERAYNYGMGIGRVWRKHDLPLWYVAYHLLRPLGGSVVSLMLGRWATATYRWRAFRGRLSGWLAHYP